MKPSAIFINQAGRLRSGWRFIIFIVAAYLITNLLFVIATLTVSTVLGADGARAIFESNWGHLLQAVIILLAAFFAGWACGAVLEGLPLRALGLARHRGWLRDWFVGSLIGIASLLLAVALAMVSGSLRFTLNGSQAVAAIMGTLTLSLLFFIIAAASEEVTFRGYPLQTMTRSHIAWVAIVITAALFAYAHLNNPNVEGWGFLQTPFGGRLRKIGWGFMNTTLAGVWLAVAYLRTRSLWLPLGIHWSWNWMLGAVLGLPVSGIERLTAAPLLRPTDLGPTWLTGGAYGIEGGAACTIALVVSTVFIWRTQFISATDEMMLLTNQENPRQAPRSIYQPFTESNQPPTPDES